jgi:hypothetical protein
MRDQQGLGTAEYALEGQVVGCFDQRVIVIIGLAAVLLTSVSIPAPGQTTSAAAEPEKKANIPRVEVYVPSMSALAEAARRSNTAQIYRGLAGMVPEPTAESDEESDLGAALKLLEQVASWPDTSVAFTAYTQDQDGRPRWAMDVDWPLVELCGRLKKLLDAEEMKKVLKDVALKQRDDGGYQLELPDTVLAVLTESGKGTLIASAEGLHPPDAIFGQEAPPASSRPAPGEKDQATGKTKKVKKTRLKKMLVYCRLNMAEAEEGEQSNSPFASLSVVTDIRFGMSLDKDGEWAETAVVQWHPLLGMAVKAMLEKLDEPFEGPKNSYLVAALNAGFAEGLADSLADLPHGTIGGRASSGMGVAVVPGTGFLPLPDVYFQFRVRGKDKIVKAIREAIEKDERERVDEDRPLMWHEETVDGQIVFWVDPQTDGGSAMMPATYRTVLFFTESEEKERKRESKQDYLIIAQTPAWASDAVQHWKELMASPKSRITVPDTKQAHWQARMNWGRVYELLQPYLALAAGLSKESAPPPAADELNAALTDSVLNIRIEYGGLQVSHKGPVPVGALYVPAMIVAGLGATADPSSEAERERVACQHLRVLYHHAKLFKKDYDRWPATVAELDGYVDFASHPDLLRLRPKEESVVGQLAILVSSREAKAKRAEADEAIDDSLYEIDWSPETWKLKIRHGEFLNYKTIYIDENEKIVRVPKPKNAEADQIKAKDSSSKASDGAKEKSE